jgi:rhamnosyltransferase
MTVDKKVCAVIITFRPEQDAIEGFRLLRSQVHDLVVVDNGSESGMVERFRAASHELDFTLIEVGKNIGIAAAQNIGIEWAVARECMFAIFFDQDSTISEGFVAKMLHCLESDPRKERTAIVVPRYRDKRSGDTLVSRYTSDGNLELAMSSGSLIPVNLFEKIGKFKEELFIDYVDYEFSLRARSAGYVIRECHEALLLHEPAKPQRHQLFGLLPVTTASYSALRRYYLARNLVWMVQTFASRYPLICLRFVRNFVTDSLKIVLVEDGMWVKSHASMRGILDGLRGRMGRTWNSDLR